MVGWLFDPGVMIGGEITTPAPFAKEGPKPRDR